MISLFDEEGNKTSTLKKLEAIYRKGGYGPFDLFSKKENVPLGLSSKRVWELVHKKNRKFIRKDHLDYLIHEFITKTKFSDPNDLMIITPDIIQELEYHRVRTGLSAAMLLKISSECPKDLTKKIIADWIDGITKKATRQNVDFVLKNWKSQPTDYKIADRYNNPTEEKLSRSLIEITPDFRSVLTEYVSSSGLSLFGILKKWRPLPNHLALEVVAGWISGSIARATYDHIAFVKNKIGYQ